jgi:hypothetical protein
MPDNIRNEIGHFNVFPVDPFVGDKAKPVPYKRRDCYKIMLWVFTHFNNFFKKHTQVSPSKFRTG